MKKWTFTSESVTDGHPDKVADQISDSILDAILAQDPAGRVACEALVKADLAVIAGEITTTADIDIEQTTRQAITSIGYTDESVGMNGATCRVVTALNPQSPDVAIGLATAYERRLGTALDDLDNQGAGDQGLMFGYACDETEDLAPLPLWMAHRFARRLAEVRRDGTLSYLRPDGKTQLTFDYEGDRAVALRTVVISAQHDPELDIESQIKVDLIEHVIRPMLPDRFRDDDFRVIVNPTGAFTIGGPEADAGLTGRKIIMDTYGGMARHGGGAFSGKDPSKTDRCGAYAARWLAKNIVASGAASRCETQVAYAIGVARPVSLLIDTFGTEKVDPAKISSAVDELFDLRPAAIIRDLDLIRPIYRKTAAYGHFGRSDTDFTWEQPTRAEDLRASLGV